LPEPTSTTASGETVSLLDPRVMELADRAHELGYGIRARNPTPAQKAIEEALADPKLTEFVAEAVNSYGPAMELLEQTIEANEQLKRQLDNAHRALLVQKVSNHNPLPPLPTT